MQDQAASPDRPGTAVQHFPQAHDAPSFPHQQAAPLYDTRYRSANAERAGQLAKALGWFSIGLGIAQLLAPRRVSRTVGVNDQLDLMRAIGVRELATGVGILSQSRPSNWLWTRVAGDAMDLAMLGMAARSTPSQRRRVALATAAVAGVAVLDLMSSMENAQREKRERGEDTGGVAEVRKSIAINRSPEECYRFWHDFENFPNFMHHLKSVQITGENRMRWKARGPAGVPLEWDAEITADEPNRYIAWRSLQSADVDNAGNVRFEPAPGGRGTIVRVEMQYRPPGGTAGTMLAKLFGEDPARQIDEDLRRFKWLIETGEIPTTIGQPSGPRSAVNRLLFRKGAPG